MNTSSRYFSSSVARPFPVLAACLGLACATQALAAPGIEESTSETVSYADLDLSSKAGASVLYSRIRRAAERVCGPTPSPAALGGYRSWNACRSSAISTAVATVNEPVLTAMHHARTGKTEPAPTVAQRRPTR